MADGTTPVHIDDEMAARIGGAFDDKKPLVVAYVDADGQAHLSFRGSTQGFSDTQLAIWVREAGGGLLKALPNNPRLSLMYRDTATKLSYLIYGRASVVTDPAVSQSIYDNSPQGERDRDPEQKGVAIVIDVDAIEGGNADKRINMRG